MTTPAARLRTLMNQRCVAMPGAFNALCARAIARTGFDACYISGAATSVSAGVPDVGLLSLEHFSRCIREAADACGLPVLADADTGFGEAEFVRRTVIEYARAGAAGLHLEDQKFPKRCGHLDGKELVPVDHMVEKLQWAVRAAKEHAGKMTGHQCDEQSTRSRSTHGHLDTSTPSNAIIICARTDAKGVEGFDAAVSRAKAYVAAGAEMIFPEGLSSEQEFSLFAAAMGRGPHADPQVAAGKRPYLLANMTEFGKTPNIPLSKFAAMGYSCVIYPVSMLRVAMGAVTKALEQLQKDGHVDGFVKDMQTRQQLYDLINYKPGVAWELPA